MPRLDPCSGVLNSAPKSMKDKKLSARESVFESIPPEPFFTKFQDRVKYDAMWYDDPIEGEDAIASAQALQHKIEEKATPIRFWLEKNIVPLLIQALNALVAKRPDNIISACEFVSDHLLKYNPLKDTYPDPYKDLYAPKPIMRDDPCGGIPELPEEVVDEAGNSAYNPCDCAPKEDPGRKTDAAPSAAQLAKKGTIASDAGRGAAAPDAIRASVLARAKTGSVKK